jgi:hypothetical protein
MVKTENMSLVYRYEIQISIRNPSESFSLSIWIYEKGRKERKEDSVDDVTAARA